MEVHGELGDRFLEAVYQEYLKYKRFVYAGNMDSPRTQSV